jgi:hypothetical protein
VNHKGYFDLPTGDFQAGGSVLPLSDMSLTTAATICGWVSACDFDIYIFES